MSTELAIGGRGLLDLETIFFGVAGGVIAGLSHVSARLSVARLLLMTLMRLSLHLYSHFAFSTILV